MKEAQGFTLIEMAVVVLVTGLLFSSVVSLYDTYLANRNYRTTVDNINLAQDALGEFLGIYGRYPCPADPGLAPGHPDYGVEQCRAVTDPCPDISGAIKCQLGRDADGDGVDEPVVIGALPAVTLAENVVDVPFVANKGIDGYGMKLNYAVSEGMALETLSLANPANPNLGVIDVKDKNGRSAVVPEESAHYVVYSNGDNGLGAYTKNGMSIGGCIVTSTSSPIPPGFNPGMGGIEVEKENCDNNDTSFVQELQSKDEGSDDYYDDILFVGINNMTSLWRRSFLSPGTETYLYNTNLGFVGVGNTNPSSALHVTGDLKTESYTQTDNTGTGAAVGYCDMAEDNCLHPQFLGGVGDDCPSGQAAVGIETNTLVCQPIFTGPISFSCPPGQFVTAFSNRATSSDPSTFTCSVIQ